MTSSVHPRIAIVGAGLAGLLCARVLQQHGVPVTVYEREPSPESRTQGGTLDLHADTGQRAMRTAGLYDAFAALARPEGQEAKLLDHTGTVLGHTVPEPGETAKPEIDRGQLRALLLDALAPGTVRWGQGVDAVDTLDAASGSPRLRFADGTTVDADLVVGADGAWSRVRRALGAEPPFYTGATFVELWLDDVDTRQPELAALVGAGMLVAKGGDLALFAQRNSNGQVRVYAVFHGPLDWHTAAGVDLSDPAAVRAHLLAACEGWAEPLRALIARSEDTIVNRPIHAVPVPTGWPRAAGVTLLGDAAHLMPPLGFGANLALLDGAELATALVTEPTVEAAVRAYEDAMLPRSSEAAAGCLAGMDTLLDIDDDEPIAALEHSTPTA